MHYEIRAAQQGDHQQLLELAAFLDSVNLPNDALSKDMLRNLLKNLSTILGNEVVDVDTSVFNAARIVKLYGTAARKGDATPDRPHRRSQFLE